MNSMKLQILKELMDHLSNAQGADLKSLLDQSKQPMHDSPEIGQKDENSETDGDDPKGLKIESLEVMKKPKSFDDQANQAIADASDGSKKKTLGETIGYPGFDKKKPTGLLDESMDSASDRADSGMPDSDMPEMKDEELEELLKRLS
jgi:hypothetical protein